jgi:hypothetical protein
MLDIAAGPNDSEVTIHCFHLCEMYSFCGFCATPFCISRDFGGDIEGNQSEEGNRHSEEVRGQFAVRF